MGEAAYRDYLSSSDDLHVSRTLACALGLNASIFVRRVQEWLEFNAKGKSKSAGDHFKDGRWWTYNTHDEWVDDFKVFSLSTLRRAVAHVESLGIVISTSKYNERRNDSTKWYSIDYEVFDDFMLLWDKSGRPNGNRLDKDYNELLAQWSQYRAIMFIVGLFKMNTPAVQDEQPHVPVPAVQDEQSVTSGSVESAGGARPQGIGIEKAKLILAARPHMRRFELQGMLTHPIIDAYSEALGATHIASEKDKIAALEAEVAGYVPQDVKELIAAKRKENTTGKPFKYLFGWMINDLASFKAAALAVPQPYITMSPAEPTPADHVALKGEALEAQLRAAAEKHGLPYTPPATEKKETA